MKILLLAPHPFYSQRGTPIAVRSLIEVLASKGHSVHVLTYHLGQDVAIPGCQLHRIPRWIGVKDVPPGFSFRKLLCDLALTARCHRLMRRERFDLVHAVEEAAFIAMLMQRRFGVPFVYDMDSSLARQMVEKYAWLRLFAGLLERCEARAVRASCGVLAVCRALAERASRYAPGLLLATAEDVSLLDGAETNGERLIELTRRPGPIVMYVGNLEAYQGIDLLIDAFARVLQQVPQAQLVVIGGTERSIEDYRRRCLKAGLDGRAHLIGPRPLGQLGHYLAQADVLVSPRIRGENTAMKVYSYMDSGVALLATRLPTHTQVLDDDVALLVAPEPLAMAQGLIQLLRDEGLRRDLGRRARERARQEHTPEAFRRKLEDFYEHVELKLAARNT